MKIIYCLRFLLIGFGLMLSGPVFSEWRNPNSGACPLGNNYQNHLNFCTSTYDGSTAWRMVQLSVHTSVCAAGYKWQCQYWWPYNSSPCTAPQVWDQPSQQCTDEGGGDPEPDCTDKTGDDAGIVENSPSPPGYDLLCFDGCAVEVSEFFQRTDNNNWVIAYRYTGQLCGPGDPLGEPDVPPGEEGPPAINPNTPPDTDGDGIPDDNDDDIDGDGIPNSQDSDMDGDGIADDDDPSPAGPPQQQQTSAANVALDCRQAVACSGDAIQCAQLVELHRLRCAGNLSSQHITDLVGDLEGWGDDMLNEAINAQIDGLEDGISEFDDIAEGSVSTFGEMIKGFLPQPVSCSVYTVEFPWPVGARSFDCEMFDTFKLIYGWFLSILVLIYCWHMAIQPVNR